jgi:hypothetical protein
LYFLRGRHSAVTAVNFPSYVSGGFERTISNVQGSILKMQGQAQDAHDAYDISFDWDKAYASGGMVSGRRREQFQTSVVVEVVLEKGRSGVHDTRET